MVRLELEQRSVARELVCIPPSCYTWATPQAVKNLSLLKLQLNRAQALAMALTSSAHWTCLLADQLAPGFSALSAAASAMKCLRDIWILLVHAKHAKYL